MNRMIRSLTALLHHTQLTPRAHCRLLHGNYQIRSWQMHGTRTGYQQTTGSQQAQTQLIDATIGRECLSLNPCAAG